MRQLLFLGTIGCLLAFVLHGETRLAPTSTLWLSQGDVAQHFLGWHFFRGEPWTLPPGANPRYGLDMGSSIVFTDSIPLFALAFKALNVVLPAHFQYAGIWVMLCFALQAMAGWLLLRQFTTNTVVLLAGSALFLLSPAMVTRSGGHFALTAHWTILLGFYLYQQGGTAAVAWRWRALLVVTALIHAYLLYFAVAIWLAATLRELSSSPRHWPKALGNTVASILMVVAAMWFAGWFALPVESAMTGAHYGHFAANMASLVSPPWPSTVPPHLPEAPTATGIESIHYLGLGAILLALCAAALAIHRRQLPIRLASHTFLLQACIAFTLLAFSHNMFWGETQMAALPLPDWLRLKLEFMRGSGRLLWMAHYLIVLAALVFIVRLAPARWAAALVFSALAVQVFDLAPAYRHFALQARQSAAEAEGAARTALRSPFWSQAAMRYTEVDFFPVVHMPPRYEPIARWAGDHHAAINAAYFARIPGLSSYAGTARINKELTTGQRRANTLYLLQDRADLARLVLVPGDGVGDIDGYCVVAPGWFAASRTGPVIEGLRPFPPK